MKYFFYFLAIILLLSLDIGFFSHLKIFGAVPNLILVLLVVSALDRESLECFFIAVVGGIFLDFYTASYFGSFSFAFLILAGLLQILVNNFLVFDIDWKLGIGAIIVSTILIHLFIYLFNLAVVGLGLGMGQSPYLFDKTKIFFELFYNLLMLLPTYKLLDAIKYFLKTLFTRRRNI
jgi:rod shape-determining protein MreD